MAEVPAVKLYNNFTKGLITEADQLTYPENSAADMDNCVPFIRGNVKRRYGIDWEPDAQASPYNLGETDLATTAINEYKWENVGKAPNFNFLVVQIGVTLYFYDLDFSPLSSGRKSFTVDLSSYLAPGAYLSQCKATMVSMSAGRGELFVAQRYIEPIKIFHNSDTDTLTVTQVIIQVRDLVGVNDGLALDEEPTSLSNLHNYNLQNQGWLESDNSAGTTTGQTYITYSDGIQVHSYTLPMFTKINTYHGVFNRYPSNNKQWFIGKDNTDSFSPLILNRFAFGNTPAPRGHFVVNAFYVDRSAVSGIPGITVETSNNRPTAVEFFNGRVWWLCRDTVYYTQVLDDKTTNIGACYQAADPTSETDSALVATDGGKIPIHQLGDGLRLMSAAGGMLVFGTLGVWYIAGTASTPLIPGSGFTSTDINVINISKIGTDQPWSIVSTDTGIFWISKSGIQVIDPGNIALASSTAKSNVSLKTIQAFYNANLTGTNIKATYDPSTNLIQWLFQSSTNLGLNVYDRILNFDLTLGAFYPWTINVSGKCYIIGVFINPTLVASTTADNVVNSGVLVLDHGVQVVTDTVGIDSRDRQIRYVTLAPTVSNYYLYFSDFTSATFSDWSTFSSAAFSSDGLAYSSFLLTGHELLQDAIRNKRIPWLFTFFNKTETGYQLQTTGDYDLANPSSCMFQVRWDWSDSATSNRWTTAREAYILGRIPPFDAGNLTFNNGFDVIKRRHRIRGSGKSMQFYFYNNSIGSNFDLLGWSVQYMGQTTV